MTVPGSSLGVDQIPVISVALEATRAGWCLRVGPDVLASGGWESAEASAVKAAHVVAVARKAETSLTGVPPKRPGSPGVAWPLPWSVTTLIAAMEAAMTEHAQAALAWWTEHGVEDLMETESPWLVVVSDVNVTATRGRSVGEVRSLQGLGSSAFILGSLTGRYPASMVISCPDAGERHQPKHGGTGQLRDYWPAALRGVAAKAKAPLGRASWTVGGDGSAAFVEVYGLTVPARVLTEPVVMPARTQANVDAVDRDVYVLPVPVTVGRDRGVQTPPAQEAPVGRSAHVPADARGYLTALRAHVIADLGASPTLVDVLRACAVATVQVPTPAGVTRIAAPDLAHLLVTKANLAPALNVGDVRAAIDALNAT
jgi:hypothetical protein